ncbi:MAG: hypothetical protein H6Q15_1717 [Bacteroidetes bacterium]|nr:hypothetical protein [Bacteroidota bacterium]
MNRENTKKDKNKENLDKEDTNYPLTKLYFVDSNISPFDKPKSETIITSPLTNEEYYNLVINIGSLFENRITIDTLKYIHINKRLPPGQDKIRISNARGNKAKLFRLIILLEIKVSECNRIFKVTLKNGEKPTDECFYDDFVHHLSPYFPDFDFSIYPNSPVYL